MRKWLLVPVLTAVAGIAALAQDAAAACVVDANLHSGSINLMCPNGYPELSGWYDLHFTGSVGTNTATVTGVFHTTGGAYASYFGGVGGTATISATLTNFYNSTTGATGINTPVAFHGDIFAQAATFTSSSQYISFDFGSLTITGNSNTAWVGMGSTSTPTGRITGSGGTIVTNFNMDRVTYAWGLAGWGWNNGTLGIASNWTPSTTSHTVTSCPPVPEPSTYAMAALAFAGLGAWGWRRRKSAAA